MRRLIDSHVHMESFDDPETVVQRSKDSDIDAIICVGGSLSSSKIAKRLATEHPGFLYPALGVHPSEVLKDDIEAAITYIRENLDSCVAVGEIGLDYAYSFAKPKDVRARMRDIFSMFLDVAAEFDLPTSIHSRSAYKDSLELAAKAGVEGVFHWYAGPLHTLKAILDAGFYVSATPSVAYSKGARAVMAEVPLERVLVETDSPVYLRNLDRKSTPVDVGLVVESLAELKGLEASEVSMVTARNAERLFRLP